MDQIYFFCSNNMRAISSTSGSAPRKEVLSPSATITTNSTLPHSWVCERPLLSHLSVSGTRLLVSHLLPSALFLAFPQRQ